ncbi:transcription factor Adf-1 [Parasteatoda tepidariorum]|uniref:transcription factor Adf-1 n=1 Tax=Parasteatoda tepidariorum TaxID=114398 RepID=UPI00077FC9C1|nr:transcription factor Adf-1 [Parasteatoda tepidariorum]
MEKRLISKVFEHELLYALDAVDYRDRHMRAMAWSEIGKELGIPASQCKDMWRKLRNCYLNAINRRQNKNIPKWKYEDEMSFLLPFIEIRSSSENNNNSAEQSSTSLSNVSATYNGDDLGSPILMEHEDSSEMILPETSSVVTKTEPREDNADYFPYPKRRCTTLDRAATMHHHRGKDEIDMFFLSICETVKRLSAVDQAKIKMELSRLVYEAEIRALEQAQYEETL